MSSIDLLIDPDERSRHLSRWSDEYSSKDDSITLLLFRLLLWFFLRSQGKGGQDIYTNGYFHPRPIDIMGNRPSSNQSTVLTHKSFNGEINLGKRRDTADTMLLKEADSLDAESDEEKEESERRSPGSSRPACWGRWIVDAVPYIFNRKLSALCIMDVAMTNDSEKSLPLPAKPVSHRVLLEPQEVMMDRLSREGDFLERHGQLDAALESYLKCLGLNELQTTRIGHAYYQVGALQWKRGAYEESIHNLDEALYIYQEAVMKRVGSLPEDIIEVLLSMTKTYISMGNRQLAKMSSKQALQMTSSPDVREKRSTKLQRAKAFHLLGKIDETIGNVKRAMSNFNEALHLQRAILGSSHVDVAATLLSFGSLCEKLNRYPEAQCHYVEAYEIYNSQTEHLSSGVDMGVALTNIGWIRYLLGDYEGSLQVYQEALNYLRQTLGDDHRNIASVLIQTGMVYVQQGNLEEALQVYSEALGTQRKALGDDHEDVLLSFCHMGSTLQLLGHWKKALQYVSHALSIQRKAFGTDNLHVAGTLVHLASIYHGIGDKDSSISCYTDALEIYKSNKLDAHDARVLQAGSALQAWIPLAAAKC